MINQSKLAEIIGRSACRKLPFTIGIVARMTYDELRQRGISAPAARRIRAAIDLAREVAEPNAEYSGKITGPVSAMAYCRAEFIVLANHGVQEEVHVVSLDAKNRPIGTHRVTVGTLRNSLVHPREVFRPAIADSANSILLVHNHPSGDCCPSDQDLDVTKRIMSAGELIGIPLVDHIVVARGCECSIREFYSL